MFNMDINKILEKAGGFQGKIEQIEEEISKIRVTGESGAGMVKVTMNGKKLIQAIVIENEAMTAGKAVVEDLVKAAVNQAVQHADVQNKARMADMMGGLDLSKFKSFF